MAKRKVAHLCIQDRSGLHIIHNAISFSNQYKDVVGVDQYIDELKERAKGYQEGIYNLSREETESLEFEYSRWANIRWIIYLMLGNISVSFLTMIQVGDNIFQILFRGSFYFSVIAGVLVSMITLIMKLKYKQHCKKVMTKINLLYMQYIKDIPNIRNCVDELYLNSLEPLHKEQILTRRDQERQHRERLEQERYNAELLKRQLAATQKLLDIENEREQRWKY